MMGKVWTIIIVSLLVFAGVIGIITYESEFVSASNSKTLYVGGTGLGNYSSIQDAIDDANIGDTIFVFNGTFYENLEIINSINLVGEDIDNVIINGNGINDVVHVRANWVNITGFTITNSGSNWNDSGIELSENKNCKIINNKIILNNGQGIFLHTSNYNNIKSNDISSNNKSGINLVHSSNNNMVKNSISFNNLFGIRLYFSDYNNVTGNDLCKDYNGIYLYGSSYNAIINNNISHHNTSGIYLYMSPDNNIINNNVFSNGVMGIYISSSDNILITNNIILSNRDGLWIDSSSDNIISCNIISMNIDSGIFLRHSLYNNLSNNKLINNGICIFGYNLYHYNTHNIPITNTVNGKFVYYYTNSRFINIEGIQIGQLIFVNCEYFKLKNLIINNASIGIEIAYCSNFIIIENNVSSNNETGIYLYRSSNNNITENILDKNGDGIYIEKLSISNLITNNKVLSNKGVGIYIEDSSNSNIIKNNQITLNKKDGIYSESSDFNTIINNNISKNHGNGIKLWSSSSNNITDNNLLSNNGNGIEIIAHNNIIRDNNISSNNKTGIEINSGSTNNIKGNIVSCNDEGMYFKWTSNNTILGNFVSYNEYGIRFLSSSNNNITNNNVSNNWVGIYLELSSNINIIANFVLYNEYGITLYISHDNRIFHNNLINNVNQSFDNTNSTNFWNDTYPSGGNYWSDHSLTCPDLYGGSTTPQSSGSPDDICDFPYNIDTDSTDYYPLKNLWLNPPNAPTDLTAIAGDSHINLTWSTPLLDGGSPITNYIIYRGTTSGDEIFLSEIGNQIYYNDTGVTNGITYYYKVSAKNANGEGQLSTEVSVTPGTLPSSPIVLTATAGDSYLNIYWNPPATDGNSPIVNYRIYKSTKSEREAFFVEIENIWFYNDTSVTNGITYFYKVSAKNENGEGTLSNEISAIPSTVPTAPMGLIAIAGDSYINLTWSCPYSDGGFPITNYIIHRSTISGDERFLTQIGNISFYNDTSVTIDITYYYKVSAVNIIGEGPLSNEVIITPSPPPNQPPICIISSPSPGETIYNEFRIYGNSSDSDGTVKRVEIKIDNGEWIQIGGTILWSYYWDTTAVSNDEYTIYARAYDGENYSPEVSVNVTVSNPTYKRIFEDPWILALTIFLVMIIVIVIVIFILFIKRSQESRLKKFKPTESELEE